MANLVVEVAEVKKLLEARTDEMKQHQSVKRRLESEVINLQSLLDLDSEECSVMEVAIQKEVIIERDRTIEKLQQQLAEAQDKARLLKDEAEKFNENFEVEKVNWLDEKEKVIRYQKQLQLNYVQMYKKNKGLEVEVDQLKKSLADSQKTNQTSTKSRLFSKFTKFHESQS